MGTSVPANVSDLIAKPPEEYPPEPRYVSKYREKIIEASKQGKSAHKTMGMPAMDPDMPSQYLKKHSTPEAPKKPPIDYQFHHRPSYQRKLPVWKPIQSSELEKHLSRGQQDFTLKNVKEARKLRLNKARRGLFCVDDRFGNSYPVMLSGMFPVYRNREGFGKVPGTYPPPSKTRSKLGRQSSPVESPMAEVVTSRQSHKLKRSQRRGRSPGKMAQLNKNKYRGTRARKKSPKGEVTHKDNLIQGKPRKSRKIEQSPKRRMVQEKGRQDNEKKGKQRVGSVKRETTKPKVIEDAEINANENEKALEKDNQVASVDPNSRQKKNDGGKEVENSERDDSTSLESEVESKEERESKENYEDTTSSTISSKSKTSTARTTIPYQQPRCRYVTEDERAELLYGMKKKWDEMMNKFQCLPFVTDTQPKKKRKSQMEKELLQLEKDINTIERHPYIYVYSDSEG